MLYIGQNKKMERRGGAPKNKFAHTHTTTRNGALHTPPTAQYRRWEQPPHQNTNTNLNNYI